MAPLLRPSHRHGHDAVFACDPHATEQLHAALPALLRHAPRYELTLRPGEVLFVPAGAPHAVSNLSHTAAISANFVDGSNLELFTEELCVAALHNPQAAGLLAQLRSPAFDSKMDLRPRVLDGSRQVRKSDEMVLCPAAIIGFIFLE